RSLPRRCSDFICRCSACASHPPLYFRIRPPPTPALFPYTTLFRSTTPVIAGDSFEMDAVGALRLSPLRRGLAIDSTEKRRRAPTDRKSGSAGMPRPTSYAVFCLKTNNLPHQPSLSPPLPHPPSDFI